MSLPAGASIISIGGKRCTAIPRVAAAVNASSNFSATPAAVVVAATTPAAVAVASSSTVPVLLGSSTPNIAVAAAVADPTVSQPASISGASPSSTQSIASTSSISSPDSTKATIPTTPSATDPVIVAPKTRLSTPTPTTSLKASSHRSSNASTSRAVAQTDASVTETPTSQNTSQAVASTIEIASPTQAGEGPVQSSAAAAASISSSPKINVGSVMGGVVGGVAVLSILLFLLWRYTKRRKARDSLLTPLNGIFDGKGPGEKYEFDGESLSSTPLGRRWKIQARELCIKLRMDIIDLGSSAKAKFGQDSNAPSVNMNRGNSQFLEPIQQHSRSNSAVSGGHQTTLTARDRLADWWQHLTEAVDFNWRLRQKGNEPIDHFATTQSVNEKEAQADRVSPNFSHFLVMKDHELRQASERHRRSPSTTNLPQLNNLGLEFSAMPNPFADPLPNAQPTIPNISIPPGALTPNPFADPTPKLSSSDYVSNVRRSRGLSKSVPKNSALAARFSSANATKPMIAARYPSIAAASSRYPSTIRTSRSSYRDTVLSALSISGRNAKGRSDPFDLDRPDLLQRPPRVPLKSQAENVRNSNAARMSTRGVHQGTLQPRIESVNAGRPRIVSNAETYSSSKYSSGLTAIFSEWGDPGPDLGPVSWRMAERGNVGSSDATRGSVSSGNGSQIISFGRAL